MNMTEMKEKSPEELKKLYTECVEEQFKLRFQMGVDKNVRTHEFKRLRKDIARLLTLLNQKRRENQS